MYLHSELLFHNNLVNRIFLTLEKPCDFCVQEMHFVDLSKWMLGLYIFRFNLIISGAQVPKMQVNLPTAYIENMLFSFSLSYLFLVMIFRPSSSRLLSFLLL